MFKVMKLKNNIKLNEVLRDKINTNNNPVTIQEFKEFIQTVIPNQNNISNIKIRGLQFRNNDSDYPVAKNVNSELGYQVIIPAPDPLFVIKNDRYNCNANEQEATIENIIDDLNKIIKADYIHRNNIDADYTTYPMEQLEGEIPGLEFPLKVKDENLNATNNAYFIYEDRSNVVFIVPSIQGTDWTWTTVKDYIKDACDIVYNISNHYNLNLQALRNTIETFFENPEPITVNNVTYTVNRIAAVLKSLLPISYLQQHNLLQRLNNLINQQDQQQQDQQQQDQQQQDQQQDQQQQDQQQDRQQDQQQQAQQPTQQPAQQQQDQQQAQQPAQQQQDQQQDQQQNNNLPPNAENVNGLVILGQWDGTIYDTTVERTIFDENKRIIFSPLPFDEFKNFIRKLPAAAIQTISAEPVLFKYVNYGTPLNNPKKVYDQVYKSYKYWFLFKSLTDVTWFRYNRKLEKVSILNKSNVRNDIFNRISTLSGNDWLPAFYNDVKTGVNVNILWTANNNNIVDSRDEKTNTTSNNAAPNTAAPNTNAGNSTKASDSTENKTFNANAYVYNEIFRRLHAILGKIGIQNDIIIDDPVNLDDIYPPSFKTMFTNTSGSALIKGGKSRNNGMVSTHQLNKTDIGLITAFIIAGGTYYYKGGTFDKIQKAFRIIDQTIIPIISDFLPPQEVEKPQLSNDDAAIMKTASDAIKTVLAKGAKYGLNIQITVPGHRPDYDYIPGKIGQKQGKNWPTDNNRYFVIMFPGVSSEKYFGQDAKNFLQKFNDLYQLVQEAFDAASKIYDNLTLAIVLDNGLPLQFRQ